MKTASISNEINRRASEQSQRLRLTSDRIMLEYERLALLDPLDLFNPDGTMKALQDIPEDARRAIAGIEIRELRAEGNGDVLVQAMLKKVKLADKKGALDSLAKIMGLMREQPDTQVNVGVTVVVPDRFETAEEWQRQAGR